MVLLCVSIYHIAILKVNNDISYDDVINTSDESDIGSMLEVDLSCPRAIHELLPRFVPCPETILSKTEWFIEYQKESQLRTPDNTTTNKLVAPVYDRTNYTLHYRYLKLLLSLKATIHNVEYGVIGKQVHNIISFNQSAWTKPYILGNNDLITNAKHDLEQCILNLMQHQDLVKPWIM